MSMIEPGEASCPNVNLPPFGPTLPFAPFSFVLTMTVLSLSTGLVWLARAEEATIGELSPFKSS